MYFSIIPLLAASYKVLFVTFYFCVCAQLLGRVQFFETPWTVACQAPPSMEFSRQ